MIYTAKDRILDTLTSCVTSSRDVTVSSADRTVLEMIPLNFLTSKTYKITPKTLLYVFYSLVNKWGTLVPPVGLNRQIFYLGFSKVKDPLLISCKYEANSPFMDLHCIVIGQWLVAGLFVSGEYRLPVDRRRLSPRNGRVSWQSDENLCW